MKNPSLSDLVGGIASVTLGDDEAKRRGVQKSVLERQARASCSAAAALLAAPCVVGCAGAAGEHWQALAVAVGAASFPLLAAASL